MNRRWLQREPGASHALREALAQRIGHLRIGMMRSVAVSSATMHLMARASFVYILASRRHGTLYVGSTIGLSVRLAQHRAAAVESFTRRYGVHDLVYVERYPTLREARARERQVKAWQRAWKVALIERGNPDWKDLSAEIPL